MQTAGGPGVSPAPGLPGARAAPHASRRARAKQLSHPARVRAQRRTPRAAARAKQLSRMPGNTSSSLTLAGSDHDYESGPTSTVGMQRLFLFLSFLEVLLVGGV
ncbi:MAG TPA: hypothetical protein VGF76_03365, partial [Polyangiaceae bacterium]